MRRILCLIFIATIYNATVPLVQNCIVTNGPLNGVLYLYESLLVRMDLSPTLYLYFVFVVDSFITFANNILIILRLIFMTY